MRTIQIKIREDFSYTIQNDYLDWDMFDRIKPLYFADDTVDFFKSRRYSEPRWSDQLSAFIWVQSDQYPNNPRKYSIRSINLDAFITIVSDHLFGLKHAEKELKALINGK